MTNPFLMTSGEKRRAATSRPCVIVNKPEKQLTHCKSAMSYRSYSPQVPVPGSKLEKESHLPPEKKQPFVHFWNSPIE